VNRWIIALCALMLAAAAPDPRDMLQDPAQEARARDLFAEIRCVVCQNESIDGSDADMARDLRQVVRSQVAAGRSDQEIRTFLSRRYGEFILLRPAFTTGNALLWGGPFVIVVVGLMLLALRRRKTFPLEEALTPEEEKALKALEKGQA
jgi:cytochrome c-type biogenesis protein CcmH